MEHRAELTDEELGFACGTKLLLANIFVGIMFGTMAWVPVSLVYAALELVFRGLPTRGGAFAVTIGICVGGGVLWGVIAAERYRDVSFRFNREFLKVYRDGVERTQILWDDVESVKQGAPFVIQTRQGLRVEVPSNALISERHDNRALKNQLTKFQKPQAVPSAKRFAWIGFVTLCVGVPTLSMSKRPHEIFAETEGLSGSVWLRILPFILGATCTVTGALCLMIWLSLLSDRKKKHPYEITTEGIREGKILTRWTEIQYLTSLGRKEMQIQIRLEKGPQRLIDCEMYSNGRDLRDAILAMVPPSVMQLPSAGQGLLPGETLTAKSWTTQREAIGFLGIFAILGLALVPLAAMGRLGLRMPSDAVGFEAIGLITFLLLALVILLVCYRVDLNETGIRYQRTLFPSQLIQLDEIEMVEIRSNRGKHGPFDLMTIRAKQGSITFSSRLEKYGEIRDSILSRVPTGKVRYS